MLRLFQIHCSDRLGTRKEENCGYNGTQVSHVVALPCPVIEPWFEVQGIPRLFQHTGGQKTSSPLEGPNRANNQSGAEEDGVTIQWASYSSFVSSIKLKLRGSITG